MGKIIAIANEKGGCLRDIGQDLRDKAIRLNIDGMGTPGRLSTNELELRGLIKRQAELERRRS